MAITTGEQRMTQLPGNPLPQVDKSPATVVYILFALGLFTGGIFTIAGLIVAYIKRDASAGSWVGTHLTWLIRTFWWSLLFTLIGMVFMMAMIGGLILGATSIWYLYRIIKGCIYLNDGKALDAHAWV